MQISEMLEFLKTCADRIVQKSEKYMKTTDADVQWDCIDIVTVKLVRFFVV